MCLSFIFYSSFQSKNVILPFSLTSFVATTMIHIYTDTSHRKNKIVSINHHQKKTFYSLQTVS